ncbi:peptidoglycan recognition protein family protein [Mucilaginibacter celer]|uniref:N-acetylmuramoyl-L-alanine amidase n=1 Tax=Mucilaginibacter celer TaxID=2305508 RepID=A0A494W292_9SPHI|nr:N-acetylmuramoyl-L-alanine amidase [Mucilaginibacter celer]AYL97635.1 N-acetylmuramoyl-L-alanine amidase [Mucilaginibacter celer]
MAFSLTWLPTVLRSAGLKVAECDGWQTRGVGDVGEIIGIICHHTGNTDRTRNMPTLNALIHGRTDPTPLSGPLAQLGLGRDGTYYVVAAGKANHAGAGSFEGTTAGNTHFIGIEAENTGGQNDSPWPAIQIDAYERGVAAILKHLGKGAKNCIAHKEWAPHRKTDPDFDMVPFRAALADLLARDVPAREPIPAAEPTPTARPTLRRGGNNNPVFVKQLQQKLKIDDDGVFGGGTEAAVRAFQRNHNLVPDGIFGPKSWQILDSVA